MDLNLLPVLDALLEHGSVQGAAEELGLSASAVSRSLARIRGLADDPILVRAGRGLVPTPRALAMRERVRAALDEARAVLGAAAPTEPRAFRRSFTIRADDSVSAVIGPELIAQLRRDAPGVSLVFRAEGAEDVESLRDGRIDLDVGVQGELGPELRTRSVMEDERVVLCRGAKPSTRRRMGLRRYASAEHVDVSRRGLRRGPIDEVLAAKGLARFVRVVVPNQLAAAALVARSDAISLVSARFAHAASSMLPVHAVPAPVVLERATVALAWHPRFDGDAAHAWLRDRIAEIGRGLAAG